MMFISQLDVNSGEMGADFFQWVYQQMGKAEPVKVNLGLSKFKVIKGYTFVFTNLELSKEVKTDDKKLRVKST